MKIDNLEFIEKKNLFQVTIGSDSFFLSYEELEEYKLSIGDDISIDLFNSIVNKDIYNSAKSLAIKYASTRITCSYKIDSYLKRKGYNSNKEVLEELSQLNVYDDKLFMNEFINDKIIIQRNSIKKTKYELMKIGFKSSEINDFFKGKEDWDLENAKSLANSKLDYSSAEKIYNYLLRKGFSYDTSQKAVQEITK